jgi:hypothetical protein
MSDPLQAAYAAFFEARTTAPWVHDAIVTKAEIHVEIAAAIAAWEAAQWRPIRELKDDGVVLLYQAEGDGDDPTRVIAAGRLWKGGRMFAMEAGDAWSAPTHFRPLPKPPTT